MCVGGGGGDWTGSGDCSDHLGWIRTGSSGYGDLGIRKKQTNISIDDM